MNMLLGNRVGMEDIAREAVLILIDNINSALTAEDSYWTTKDQALATARGTTYIACTSDHVSPANIHPGHKPSFITASIDRFPNICVMSYNLSPSPLLNLDQGTDDSVRMFIETQVIQGPYDSNDPFDDEAEELVNKKIQRMVEAINKVMEENHTLNGLIDGFNATPRVIITECLRRTDNADNINNAYYWQMARFEFEILKNSTNYW